LRSFCSARFQKPKVVLIVRDARSDGNDEYKKRFLHCYVINVVVCSGPALLIDVVRLSLAIENKSAAPARRLQRVVRAHFTTQA